MCDLDVDVKMRNMKPGLSEIGHGGQYSSGRLLWLIIFSIRHSLVLALCLLSSFGHSRRCSGGNSPDSQHEVPGFSPSVFHIGFVD